MGMIIEGQIRDEMSRARTENNARLDALLRAQQEGNELLRAILAALTADRQYASDGSDTPYEAE